jgi:four helix bundle protein
MFLQLNHQNLEVYKTSRLFVTECYRLTQTFPPDEKFNLVQQIRRAATSVHLNIAEGSSRKSEIERKRYYQIARGSVIEIDAALDISSDLNYCMKENLATLGTTM